jgi:AraC-like DNA-binding protein
MESAAPALKEQMLSAVELAHGHVEESEEFRAQLQEKVAAEVFLSPSRFAHLFAQEVGLPFRRYVLWRKLSRALQLIGRGQSLSSAAHGSGFSDSAHLTRTFHQMFGLAPTVMLGGGELYEIPAPFDLPTGG